MLYNMFEKPSFYICTYQRAAIDCIGALDGTHVRVSIHPNEQVKYIGKTGTQLKIF
jgi:hypothetical protein